MNVGLLPHQIAFLESDATHTGIIGGFRSGKSHAGAWKTIMKKLTYIGHDVAYYLPTYRLIKDIAFPKFSKILTDIGVPFNIHQSDKNINTPYGRIILRSMDNPDLIIGYEVAYSLIDEADVLSAEKMEKVVTKVMSRNSILIPGCNNATDFVSTPEGFRFMYDFFVTNEHESKRLIKATTEGNPFISESYVETQKQQYTEEQVRAYLHGEFVNLSTGSVYYTYETNRNATDATIKDTSEVLHIGLDFNITNMSAAVIVVRGGKLYAVDEIVKAYDTREMCEKIADRYKNPIIIHPDASCRARKTSGFSDYNILQHYFRQINIRKENPSVRQRINIVNGGFLSAAKEPKVFVNAQKCPTLSKSLTSLAYNKAGEPDKQSGHDHITDAFAYPVFNIVNPSAGGYITR